MRTRTRRAPRGAVLVAAALLAGCMVHRPEPVAGPDRFVGSGALPEHPVRVHEDPWGIPHIRAETPHDAVFVLGFIHAEERLWQMEFNRRIGHGRLSEILGKRTVANDRFLRTLGMGRAAERALKHLDEETVSLLEAYAEGVNAGIGAMEELPPEMKLLGVKPEPWTPVDTLVWTKTMALLLSGTGRNEALRAGFVALHGDEDAELYLPASPADDLVVLPPDQMTHLRGPIADEPPRGAGPDPGAPSETEGSRFRPGGPSQHAIADTMALLGADPRIGGPAAASNNWVLAPSRTATGGPILANDPHLRAAIPSIWYLAELDAPGWHAVGATLPGAPAVVIGHNEHIAWGMTNVGPDVTDLFYERFHPEDPAKVQRGEDWEAVTVLEDVIRVKGGKDVPLTVRVTSLGPVLTEFYPDLGEEIALRWTALDDVETSAQALTRLMRASDWAEFREAASFFTVPSQNLIYADTEGNIGWQVPGAIPIRKPHRDGRLPARGWVPDDHWQGYIPFDELPRAWNPEQGYVASANNAVVPPDYRHRLAVRYDDDHRARRIVQLIEARDDWSVADTEAMQMDVISLQAGELLPVLLGLDASSAEIARAQEILGRWDGSMDMDSAGAAIYEAWLVEAKRLLVRGISEELRQGWNGENASFLESVFVGDGGRACVQPGQAPPVRDCTELAALALQTALDENRKRLGADMSQWRWGDLHYIGYNHPLAVTPTLKKQLSARTPSPGSNWTINVGAYSDIPPFQQTWLPSYRQVIDPSDWNNSSYIHSPGQSGVWYRDHYRDLIEPYIAGERMPMLFGAEAVDSKAVRVRVFEPASGGG